MLHKARTAILRTRPDRKGHGLLLMASVWLLIGLSAQTAPSISGAWHLFIPHGITAALWIGTAALAITAAWGKRLRPWAMAGLTVMPGLRFFSYLTAWLLSLIDGGVPGYPRGWVAALSQLVMIAFVFYVATDAKDTTVEDLNHVLRSTGDGR